jgi:nucleoside-diphosphate-sugar epimerase
MFAKKKILVTGGAGFIGYHLVSTLLSLDVDVHVVDIFPFGQDVFNGLSENLTLVSAFVDDFVGTNNEELATYNYIFHLAGNALPVLSVEDPEFDFKHNLQNTFSLLNALRKMGAKSPCLINMSSAAVYGNPITMPIRESDSIIPISPYGVSKLTGERYAEVFSSLYNIKSFSVRPFSVYGPGLKKQVIFDLLKKIHNDPFQIELFGDGSQMRDFIYINDLVGALLLLAGKAPARGEVYNIASGKSCTIKEIAECISLEYGVNPVFKYTGHARPGEPERWEVDISKIRNLGFETNTSLRDGIKETVQWYKNNYVK